jgi:hypothetical protein
MEKPIKRYRCVRNGKIFALMPTVKGGYYWREENYDGLFAWGATFEFNAKWFAKDLITGLLVEVEDLK